MALRKEDWEQINAAIRTAVENGVRPLKPSGWRKWLLTLKEHGILGVNATVIIALLALAATQFYYANQRVDKHARFEADTNNALKGLSERITELIKQVTQLSVSQQASLPVDSFKEILPDVTKNIANLRIQKAVLPTATLGTLIRKVNDAGPTSAGYWPVAAEIVSYRSELRVEWHNSAMAPCSTNDIRMRVYNVTESRPGRGFAQHGPIYVQNCSISLDTDQGSFFLSTAASMGEVNLVHCRILYNGGSIVIKPVKYSDEYPASLYGPISFQDCLFLFKIYQTPSESGQRLTKTLLASDGVDVKYNPTA